MMLAPAEPADAFSASVQGSARGTSGRRGEVVPWEAEGHVDDCGPYDDWVKERKEAAAPRHAPVRGRRNKSNPCPTQSLSPACGLRVLRLPVAHHEAAITTLGLLVAIAFLQRRG